MSESLETGEEQQVPVLLFARPPESSGAKPWGQGVDSLGFCSAQTRPWTLLSRGRTLIWRGPDPNQSLWF